MRTNEAKKKINIHLIELIAVATLVTAFGLAAILVGRTLLSAYIENQAAVQGETMAKREAELFAEKYGELETVKQLLLGTDDEQASEVMEKLNPDDDSEEYGILVCGSDTLPELSSISYAENGFRYYTDGDIYFTVPFELANGERAVLYHRMSNETASRKLNISGYSGYCKTVVIDKNCNTVVGYHNWKLYRSTFLGSAAYQRSIEGLFDTLYTNGSGATVLAGKRVVLSLSKISGTDYYLLGILPMDVVYSTPNKILAIAIAAFVFVSFVTAWLLFLLTKTRRQLRDNRELEEARANAEQANNAKNEFLAHMSHEIRTPINVIMGMNEIISRESSSANVRGYSDNIKEAGNSLIAIVNDILDLTKIESGEAAINPGEYSLTELVNDVVSITSARTKEKQLMFYVETEEGLPDRLMGDRIRIRQVLLNILDNAVKYTKLGFIKLFVGGTFINDEDIELRFVVSDSGIGIKEEDIPKLFINFERVDMNNTSGIKGIGLGLPITKKYLELMGGTIEVESVYGKGSSFEIRFPQQVLGMELMQKRIETIEGYKNAVKPIKLTENMSMNRIPAPNAVILAVDDNVMNLFVLKNLLKETGMRIDTATSGKECLEKLENEKYDLIFLDHMMPEMDGIETFRIIRRMKDNANCNVPVIALTANAVVGAREMYLEEGFTDYISKPVSTDVLIDKLRKYLPAEKKSDG